jgi:hypothetical protein
MVFIMQFPYAVAEDGSIEYKPVLKFGAGVVSAFLIHEAAHALVGLATGTQMDWRPGDMNQPITFSEHSSSKDKGLAINASGLLAQAIGAEFILQSDGIDKNDSYVRGMMLWNIVNPILYAVDYWFINKANSSDGSGYKGDLQGLEHYSSRATADAFTATMAAIAVFQGYRYARTQSWAPEWLKAEAFRKVGLTPLPSGGAFFFFSFDF